MDPLSMLAAVGLFSLLGALLGMAAGLVPGLHINNVAYLVSASAGALVGLALSILPGAAPDEAPLLVAALIVSCMVAQLFTSVLPSVFLGAPDPGRALSVLPAHRMLLRGRGREAVTCSLIGCVGGLATCLAILPLFRVLMGDPVRAYEKLRPFIAFIVASVVMLLVLSEPPRRREGERGAGGKRCVLVLERIRAAELVLLAPPPDLAPGIRPWQAPQFVGRRVSLAGLISEKREFRGNLSLVLEEGGAVDILVPHDRNEQAQDIRVGQIAIVEGCISPAVSLSMGAGRKLLAGALFLFSGFLGVLALSSGRLAAENWYPLGAPPVPSAIMMFPLFCGLFGLPTLLLGMFEHVGRAPQGDAVRPMPLRQALRGILSGTMAGGVIGWYPGMTSAHGSVLAKLFVGEEKTSPGAAKVENGKDAEEGRKGVTARNDEEAEEEKDDDGDSAREFLVSSSAVTVANAFFNLVALFVILKARNGALHMALELLGAGLVPWKPAENVPAMFALLVFSGALAALIALPVTVRLGRTFSSLYDRVPYRKLLAAVIALLVVLLTVFSGAMGLALAGAALCLGLVPPLAGVRRVHLMGAILVPTLLLLTGTNTGVLSLLGI